MWTKLLCARCGAPLTGQLRESTAPTVRFDPVQQAVIPVAPAGGAWGRWDARRAELSSPWNEPLFEGADGFYLVRLSDIVADLLHAAAEKACPQGHPLGPTSTAFEGADEVLLLSPEQVLLVQRD